MRSRTYLIHALAAIAFLAVAAPSSDADVGSWDALGGGVTGAAPPNAAGIYCTAAFDDGWGDGPVLYVGGLFASAGGVPASSIARWDGQAWHNVGNVTKGGSPGNVFAMTVVNTPEGGQSLVIGGEFTAAGGVQAMNVAQWDGRAWHAVGAGLEGQFLYVSALQIHAQGGESSLYAAGTFTQSGGASLSPGVARFDGRSWHQVGAPLSTQSTYRMASFDDGDGPVLVVGGKDLRVGEVSLGPLVFLKGEGGWTSFGGLATDAADSIEALLATTWRDQPTLFAAGRLRAAGADERTAVAQWSDGEWTIPGGGLRRERLKEASGTSLAAIDDGTGPAIYVGGDFDLAGGTTARGVARWNGTYWLPLANGVGQTSAEAPTSGNVDGDSGDVAGSADAALNFVPYSALSILLDPTADRGAPRVVVAGGFEYAGDELVRNIAAWIPAVDPRPGPFLHRCGYDLLTVDATPAPIRRLREGPEAGEWLIATSKQLVSPSGVVTPVSPLPGAEVEINDSTIDGIVAGTLSYSSGGNLPFRLDLSSGRWTILEGARGPCNFCDGNAVSPDGTVVGSIESGDAPDYGMFTADAQGFSLVRSPPEASLVEPSDINGAGEIVGRWHLLGLGYRPFRRVGTEFETLPVPPETLLGAAQRINGGGVVVGRVIIGRGQSDAAARWIDGRFELVPGLDGASADIRDINDAGDMVGQSATSGGPSVSVLWSNGTVLELASRISWRAAWQIDGAAAIGASGRIAVGWRGKLDGVSDNGLGLLSPREPSGGDVDGDCRVDGYDLGLVMVEFGRDGSSADVNGDGTVDGADLGILLSNWGR